MPSGTTSIELLAVIGAALCALLTLYFGTRTVPFLVARQLRDWERRIVAIETFKGDMAVQLEQLGQLDASVAKSRQRITTENRRADQRVDDRGAIVSGPGGRSRDELRRAAAEQGLLTH